MDYSVCVCNQICVIQSGLSPIEICPRSRLEPLPETISNFHVWGCPKYVLEQKFQKPRENIPKWYPRIQIGVNMGFSKMNLTQFGLVLKCLTGSISLHNHGVFDDMFYTVVNSTSTDPQVWTKLVTSRNSRNQVVLYQEDDPELDDEWSTADEQLSLFSKAR